MVKIKPIDYEEMVSKGNKIEEMELTDGWKDYLKKWIERQIKRVVNGMETCPAEDLVEARTYLRAYRSIFRQIKGWKKAKVRALDKLEGSQK